MSASLPFRLLPCVLIGVLLAFFLGYTNARVENDVKTSTVIPYYINHTVWSKIGDKCYGNFDKSLGKTQSDDTAHRKGNRYKRRIDQNSSLIYRHKRSIFKMLSTQYREQDLFIVGTYIAAQKYFGTTYINPREKAPYLFTRFPKAPYGTHKDINNACSESVAKCIAEVFSKARKSGTMGPILKTRSNSLSDPFNTLPEMALYRISAMSYLCWYALLGAKALEYNIQNRNCLSDLKYTLDAEGLSSKDIPFDARETKVSYEQQPLTCSFLWFCPDPCYGRDTNGSFPVEYFQNPEKDKGNPCRNLKNPQCAWKEDDNKSLQRLRNNVFNITCKCSDDYPGSFWNINKKKCTLQNGCGVDDLSCRKLAGDTKGIVILNKNNQSKSKSENKPAQAIGTPWKDLTNYDQDLNYDLMDFELFGSTSQQKSQFCQIFFVSILTCINTVLFA